MSRFDGVTQKSDYTESSGAFSMVHGAMKCDKRYFLEANFYADSLYYHNPHTKVKCKNGVQKMDIYIFERKEFWKQQVTGKRVEAETDR